MRGAIWKDQSKFTDPGAAGAVIDELPADLAALCAHPADAGVSSDVVAALADRDELRVPSTVTSFDPYGGPPREVTLRP